MTGQEGAKTKTWLAHVQHLRRLDHRRRKKFNPLIDIGIQTGNRSSFVGTMNPPNRNRRILLVRIPPLWPEVQNGVGTMSDISRGIAMTVSSVLWLQDIVGRFQGGSRIRKRAFPHPTGRIFQQC